MRHIIYFLTCLAVLGCSSGGGDSDGAGGSPNGPTPAETYSVVYFYPVNNMNPGDGRREVAPERAECRNSKNEVVSDSFCGGSVLALESAPKETQLSKAGILVVAVEGGQSSISLNEGDNFNNLENKTSLIAENLECDSERHKNGVKCDLNAVECTSDLGDENILLAEKHWDGNIYDACTISSCKPGRFLDGGACTVAPIGYYADGASSLKCPDHSHTDGVGTTSIDGCLADQGYYKSQLGGEVVFTLSEAGSYSVGGVKFQCPVNSTSSPGSFEIDQCIALPGYYNSGVLSLGGNVLPAGQGFFSTGDGSRTACTNTPAHAVAVTYTSSDTNTLADCPISEVNMCQSGYYRNSLTTCAVADIGWYANGVDKTSCPENSNTVGQGATSIDDCLANEGFYKKVEGSVTTFVAAEKGFYATSGAREICPGDHYQDETGKTSCKPCVNKPNGWTTGVSYTSDQGKVDSSCSIASVQSCQAGYYVNGGDLYCSPVSVGYYSVGGGTTQSKCTNLPSNATAVNYSSGAISNDCPISSVVSCSSGYTPSGVTCVDACQGAPTPGTRCMDGTHYLGTLGSYKYKTTPGNCTNSATPTCDNLTDTLTKAWANNSGTTAYGVSTGRTSTTDGPGNSSYLATNYTDTDAAKYCENMTFGGRSDWFLPAKDELNLMWTNVGAIPGLNTSGTYYWSSTEINTNSAWAQRFSNGYQMQPFKYDARLVRCVRRF